MKNSIKRNSWTLQTKMTILSMIVVLLSISIIMFFIIPWAEKSLQSKVEINVMNVASIVSESPTIKDALLKKDPNGEIQTYVEKLLQSVNNIEFIVVADMNGIRYAHPNPERVGEKFVGGDEYSVINTGESYISEANGTLGKSMRAFTPIYDKNGVQIGFVSVGTLFEDIEKAKMESIKFFIILMIIGLLVGTTGAFLLAKNIKASLLGLEPNQISKLYNENIAMIDAIHEGIIAIDEKENITLINESAMSILKINEKDKNKIIGRNILEIFPTSKLHNILESGEAEYDKEQITNDTLVIVNRVPILNSGKIIGAIATFRDKTEITLMAEELTGIKQIVEALRANSHEFANKLHVIMGLINLGEIEEVNKYIINVADNQQQIISSIVKKISDPTIAGLMLGKFSRAKELGIIIKVDENTNLDARHKNISSGILVKIIGNLLENAMEAVSISDKAEKNIFLKIQESEELIKIEVEDFGTGISEENIQRIFEKGFTTKNEGRGIGLALIKENIETFGGEIQVESKLKMGTKFTVVLPKEIRR